jgi:predicted DCC family thiol-disulfide oxidoreductase YuxK
VIRSHDGRMLVKSAAVFYMFGRLGGVYRLIAGVAGVLPQSLLDWCYDGCAKIRRKLFARPPGICPVIAPHLRARFHL